MKTVHISHDRITVSGDYEPFELEALIHSARLAQADIDQQAQRRQRDQKRKEAWARYGAAVPLAFLFAFGLVVVTVDAMTTPQPRTHHEHR